MQTLIYFILSFFICFVLPIQAGIDLSTPPTPIVHGINLVTGEPESLFPEIFNYEYLGKKVKKITEKNSSGLQTVEFNYYPDYTEVIDAQQIKNVYRFNQDNLLIELGHYIPASQNWDLYRKERLFWDNSMDNPRLIRRVVEDGQGKANIAYLCEFSSKGQLVKETLVGNLSGGCHTPLIVQDDGSLLNNGIESYSVSYEYDSNDPSLLVKRTEDSGAVTHYQFDRQTKRCTAKLRGNQDELLSRYFYEYDKKGFLSKTIVDDGQAFSKEDLRGVSVRKIMKIESSHDLKTYGQPLCVENKYFDLRAGKEILLDRMLCKYSIDGQLLQQEYYDAAENLMNTTDGTNTIEPSTISAQEIDEPQESRLTSIDAYGNETQFYYDPFGRLIETVLPSVLDKNDNVYRPKLLQKFNVLDHLVQTDDSQGNLTTYAYTIRNKPARIDYPDGSFESYLYRLDGEVSEQIEKNGTKTLFFYDSLGRISSKQLISAEGIPLQELFYTYQGTLKLTATDGKSFMIRYRYDGAGRKIGYEYESPEGVIRQIYSYDSKGRLVDSADEKLEKGIPGGTKKTEEASNHLYTNESKILNDRNQFVKFVEIHDENGCKQFITYDALERAENRVTFDPMGMKISETEMRYDIAGQIVLEKHHRLCQGKVINTFLINKEFDAAGRLIEIREGSGTSYVKKTSYEYNSYGQLTKLTYPSGVYLNYIYNQEGLLNRLTSSDDSVNYEYQYDELYRLIEINDGTCNKTQSLAYDGFNQLIEDKNDRYVMKHGYDNSGRCTLLTLPDESSVRYIYEQDHLRAVERLAQDQSVLYSHGYEYDLETNRLIAGHLIKDMGTIRYRFDQADRAVGVISPWWSQSIPQNGFDHSGRALSMQISDPLGEYKQVFNYAQDGQLKSEDGQDYVYDSLYNRAGNDSENYEVNEINQLTNTSHYRFVYDKNGNLVKKFNALETHLYSYDALNRLKRYENNQNFAIDYHYDAFNRRVEENRYDSGVSVESFYYLYDGQNEIGKMDSQGRIVELRIPGQKDKADIGSAVAIELQGRLYAPIHDINGSVRCLIDTQDRSVAEFYRYSCFGKEEIYDSRALKVEHSLIGNPWRYFSKRYEEATKLIFFGLRYYDPSICRWTTPDPCFFCDTPNLYAFVKNDPLNHYDLQGLFSISTLWNTGKQAFVSCCKFLKSANAIIKERVRAELQPPQSVCDSFESVSQTFLGKCAHLMLGYTPSQSRTGVHGEREIDKVRITFINGILSTDNMLQENLDLISQSHGGIKVHYVFRGTNGWTSDIGKAILIRTCFYFGYRSIYAHRLAETWRDLIQEMGGVDGGGIIIHYAHSLGGCDTDRARSLLTPEEQKMIRVFTFGSATMIRNEGFDSVINIISINDGVATFLEPLGHFRNFFDPNTNVHFYGQFSFSARLSDHMLRGLTYKEIMLELGRNFVDEFLNNEI